MLLYFWYSRPIKDILSDIIVKICDRTPFFELKLLADDKFFKNVRLNRNIYSSIVINSKQNEKQQQIFITEAILQP